MSKKLEEKYIFNRTDNGKFVEVDVKITNNSTVVEVITISLNDEKQKTKNKVMFAISDDEKFVSVNVKFKKDNTIVEVSMTIEKIDDNTLTKPLQSHYKRLKG